MLFAKKIEKKKRIAKIIIKNKQTNKQNFDLLEISWIEIAGSVVPCPAYDGCELVIYVTFLTEVFS